MLRVVFLSLVLSATALAQMSDADVDAALNLAIKNVETTNQNAKENIGEDKNPHAQIASEQSADSQRIGDVMQETTRLLVSKFGKGIISALSNVNMTKLIEKVHDSFTNATVPAMRVKRQYGPSKSTGGGGPLDVSCIDRPSTCDIKNPFRSISGWCNNLRLKSPGSTLYKLRRFMGTAAYDDGFSTVRRASVAGGTLPSARLISNKIFQEASIPAFDPTHSHMLMQFGQFVAHDIIFGPTSVGANGATLDCSACDSPNVTSNCAPIEVPAGDAYFPVKTAAGKPNCIRLTRVINGQTGLGPRTPINQNSHFLDLSDVYGSSDCVARSLRTMKDGQLKTFNNYGYYLPPQDKNDTNCQSSPAAYCFLAGDSRNSLHPGLIPLHTAYIRHHNSIAMEMRKLRKTWSDNIIFEETRRLTVALWQNHVYKEYLPRIIGTKMMAAFDLAPKGLRKTYDADVDPSVSAEFGAAAFRFGHSMARKDIPCVDTSNRTVGSYVDLGANIFYADSLYDKAAGIFSMMRGLISSPAMAVDRQFSFPIRNQLFETRGKKASGVDLPAVNIQRAREMGVQAYNDVRARITGLSRVASFDDLKKDMTAANVDLLKAVYKNVNDVDLYVGLLLETPTDPTAILGPTGSFLIADQFRASMKGDRFFYESLDNPGALTPAEYKAITNYSLAQLFCENSNGLQQINSDVFAFKSTKVSCSSFKPFSVKDILFG